MYLLVPVQVCVAEYSLGLELTKPIMSTTNRERAYMLIILLTIL